MKELLKELEDRMKRFNICLTGILGDSREDGEKALFYKIMPRTFQNLRMILIFRLW